MTMPSEMTPADIFERAQAILHDLDMISESIRALRTVGDAAAAGVVLDLERARLRRWAMEQASEQASLRQRVERIRRDALLMIDRGE